MEKQAKTGFETLETFKWVCIIWLFIGEIACFLIGPSFEDKVQAAFFMFGFWALSALDLWVWVKLMETVIHWMNAIQEKRTAYSIQAFCWGIFKIVCLGLFIGVLLKGYQIPTRGLFLGVSTLGVVPLIGGLLWSQRVLRNA